MSFVDDAMKQSVDEKYIYTKEKIKKYDNKTKFMQNPNITDFFDKSTVQKIYNFNVIFPYMQY